MRGRRPNSLINPALSRARARVRARKQPFPQLALRRPPTSRVALNASLDLPLETLPVLILDAQATTSYAAGGHLLEIGWGVCSAAEIGDGEPPLVSHRLVALPEGTELPPQVAKVTGITKTDLSAAIDSSRAWRFVADSTRHLSAALDVATVPTVIHFQAFEAPFLRYLHRQNNAKAAFPLNIICTHEITRRLMPWLPRKGLRAVSGYFGHGLSPLRRCEAHVVATMVIWHQLVGRLARCQGVRSLAQLQRWLACDNRPVARSRVYPMQVSQRSDVPDAPGVYHLLRANGDLLYVGKATSLRRRVASYFQPGQRHAEKTLEMLTQARRLRTTPTGSALEAALLEVAQIQEKRPPYNTALKPGRFQLCFTPRDFACFKDLPDDHHRLGPLPVSAPFVALHQLGCWLQAVGTPAQRTLDPFDGAVIGLFGRQRPDNPTIAEGLRLFHGRFAPYFDRPVWSALAAIGRHLLGTLREKGSGDGPSGAGA